jgi:putative DNA primase/helicase
MSHADDAFASAVAELWPTRLKKTEAGTVKDDPFNVSLYLSGEEHLRDMLAMDRFSHRIAKRREPPWHSDSVEWSETDAVLLRVYLAERYSASFSLQNVEHAVVHVASKSTVHPVHDYLESLEWDGQPRLDTWLAFYLDAIHYASSSQLEYIYLVGRLWLIAAVARVYEPGCKFDNVLILEGDQGVGKSTALGILAGAWFMDTPFRIGDKDAYQALPGNWIVELAELENFSGVESSRAKAFFSSATDTFRPSYGRRTQEFRRQCVFAGTTNQLEYLKDSTGNRRYWPVRCHRLLRDELIEDRDQLWAEAFKAYRAGSVYHVPRGDPLWAVIEDEQRSRELGDPWETAIARWLDAPDQFLFESFTLHDVLERALGVDTHSMHRRDHATRVGSILHRLGYIKRKATTRAERAAGKGAYFYVKRDK